MDTWPIGTRDTTEFPKLSPIKVQYRDHLEKILQLSGRNWNDIGEFGTPSRFRSYRKMYERLGIICKNGDKLVSTWLGEKVEKLEQGLLVAQQAYLDQMRNEIIAILSRSCCFLIVKWSFSGNVKVIPKAIPRGMIETLCNGSQFLRSFAKSA